MALTDIFISPAGAGDGSGNVIGNAVPAISSNDWSSEIKALDRANKRFIFLGGTYTVGSKLTFTGSAPTNTTPNQWIGADSSGNILRPKFDESGLRLDLTDYPLFVNTANTEFLDAEEDTFYKCLSFVNTNTSYNKSSVIDATSGDSDRQGWFGCNFKAHCANVNSEVIVASGTYYHMCVFESTGNIYDRIVDGRTTHMHHCRVIGPATSGLGGDGDGYTVTTGNGTFTDCIITRVHGHGYRMTATNDRNTLAGPVNCTIINTGGDGVNSTTLDGTSTQSTYGPATHNTIIFNAGAYGMNVDAEDSRQEGPQLMAMGENSTANFNNMDSYEDMIDVITITAADFVDYANNDFRIRRDSPLYKLYGTLNVGAINNEDYEFASVS